jgi:hypothetical protein
MPSEPEKLAPEGQTWLCGACGRHNKNKYKVGDESCYMNSVLVYEESIMMEDGVLITAEAVNDPEGEIGS